MKKVGKREKIILAVMAVVLLYGVYALFFESSSDKSKAPPAVSKKQEMTQIDTLVTTVAVTLKDFVDTYIIDHAQKTWVNDPFYIGPAPEKENADAEVANFFYTGYIEYDGVRLAIINGVDYRTGEMLEVPGYTLINIAPSKVLIEDKEGQRKITVPFMEE
jgi:hypothetical protein